MYDDLTGTFLAPADASDAGAIRFRRVRDLGDVVNASFRLVRDNARELALALLVIAGPFVLLGSAASYFGQRSFRDALGTPDPTRPFAIFEALLSPLYLLSLVLTVLVPTIVMAVTFAYIERYRAGEAGSITPGRVWAAMRPRLFGLLTTSLLLTLIAVATLFIPCVGVFSWLYLLPLSGLVYVARVTEAAGFRAAWSRARAIMSHYWGQTFGVMFVTWLLILLVMSPLFVVLMAVGGMSGLMSMASGAEIPAWMTLASAASSVVVSFLYTVPFSAQAFQYFNLAERHDGTGLDAEVAALAGPAAARDADETDRPFAARPPAASTPGDAAAPVVPETPEDGPSGDFPAALQPSPPPSAAPERPRGFQGGGFDDDARS